VVQAVAPPENQSPSLIHQPARLEILLDNLRSTWNVGSMLRTADGAGVRRFYLCGITPTPEHPRVARTALGAEKTLTWSWHPNSLDLADQLIASGCALWALEEAPNARPITSTSLADDEQRIVLIVGNEIYGVDPGLLERCERILHIPMHGIKRSLNAAVAFGIAVYLLFGPLQNPAQRDSPV
jgi:tRNA G18 (ribose-2'-O)-methylase SpoU